MNKLKIGLDMDGVVCDFLGRMLYLLNRYHGEDLKPSDITSWDIEEHCVKAKKKHIYKYIDEPGFFRHLDPMPGAIESITELAQNHDIYFITACNSGGVECKRAWIEKHLPMIPERNFIGTQAKEMVRVDIFMDDKLDNLKLYKAAWPTGASVVAFDQPYNREWDGFRVADWEEFYRLVDFHA